MPPDISASGFSSGVSLKIIIALLVLFIVVGAVLISKGGKDFLEGLWPALYGSVADFPPTPILTQSSEVFTIPSTLATASALETGTVTPASPPTPALITADSATLLPNPHRFEVVKIPLGSDQGFLVHVVVEGEALEMLAANYNTTLQAIRAVNFNLKPPIWAQYPIVIPVGANEATGLPALEVYVVGDAYEEITAEALADILGVDAVALGSYNLCTSNCRFHKGDVLLVPGGP